MDCRTIHSLAHQYTIPGTARTLNTLTPACITEEIDYEAKLDIIQTLDTFFSSSATSYAFFDNHTHKDICIKYVDSMAEGTIPCTFNYCLKHLHMLLVQHPETFEPYDLLMLDEAGDLVPVTLEIFKLLPAKHKVMAGDSNQNIYSFMGTINGFQELKHEGKLFYLTKSFRVDSSIAPSIEYFLRAHLDANVHFHGTNFKDKSIKSIAYLSRTNAGLISRMIQLNASHTPFTTLRAAKDIFALPLFLISISSPRVYVPHEYKYIYNEYIKFTSDSTLVTAYKTFQKYCLQVFSADIQLKTAIKLIIAHSPTTIINTFNIVKNAKPANSIITLSTVHAAKGAEWDHVILENDLNAAISDIIDNPEHTLVEEDLTELRLYYVACTRARYKLDNAAYLSKDPHARPNQSLLTS